MAWKGGKHCPRQSVFIGPTSDAAANWMPVDVSLGDVCDSFAQRCNVADWFCEQCSGSMLRYSCSTDTHSVGELRMWCVKTSFHISHL